MKVTLVTGASGGIGEAIARKIAAQKENLLLVARNERRLRQLSGELAAQYNIKTFFLAADLNHPDAPETIYNECRKQNWEVGSLINNAGIGSGGEFAEQELSLQLQMMQLNMMSLVALTRLFIRDMKLRRSGTIVNIGSMISFMPVPYMAIYGATKAFVRFFTQALYEEAKPFHINCMLFSPGLTDSNFLSAAGLQNKTGEALTAGAPVQSTAQVSEEFIRAYLARKRFAVSGRINRNAVKLLSVIPNRLIAGRTAAAYRKKMAKESVN